MTAPHDPESDSDDLLPAARNDAGSSLPLSGSGPALSDQTDVAGYRMLNSTGGDGYSLSNPPEAWKSAGPDWHQVERVTPRVPSEPVLRPRQRGSLPALIGCNVIVFLASVCVMVLELTASRLIAKHVGSSLYTWTSVIGVVLAGITVGNFFGGWLADRVAPRKLLSWLFLIASASCFSVLWLDRIVTGRERPLDIDWPMWVFLTVAQMFFIPAVALGTISPVVASIALQHGRKTGITVGNVYAWGAMGSIIGTFLTGYWLIDAYGTRAIIAGTSGMLAVLGVLSASGQVVFRTAVVVGWMQFMLIVTAAAIGGAERFAAAGESLGRLFTSSDAQIRGLRNFRNGNWSDRLNEELRTSLFKRAQAGEFILLTAQELDDLERWLRSGQRQHLTAEIERAIDRLVETSMQPRERINQWRDRSEAIGRELHELGLVLYLRDDAPGEYHDESNYSYINVSTDQVGADEVQSLRLDKLAHSYFNFADPAKLYYEYELIYAEATSRAADAWNLEAAVTVDSFPGRDAILERLPDWARFDRAKNELIVNSLVTAERRRQLLELAPHGRWWNALEELSAQTRQPQWGGFSSVALKEVPDGVHQVKLFEDRLHFEETFGSLNAFHEITPEEVDELCAVGEAGTALPWRRAVLALTSQKREVSTFFIGGGGFVFPRWIEHHYPGSRIDVAELDPAVKLAVQKAMGLAADDQTLVKTQIGDARNVVDDFLRENARRAAAGQPLVRYDFIYGDAFNDFSVPWHLTTHEFDAKLKAMLNPDRGIYMFNIIDLWPRTSTSPPETAGREPVLPHDLLLDDEAIGTWQLAGPGYDGLEIMLRDAGQPLFGVRGVMTVDMRDRWSKRFDDPVLTAGFEELHVKSQTASGGRFLSSCVLTLSDLFPNIYVFSTQSGAPSEDRDTYVLICSMQPLDLQSLPETGQHWQVAPFAAQQTGPQGAIQRTGQMESLLATARGLVLTDDFAPVDNLLKPVFADQQ